MNKAEFIEKVGQLNDVSRAEAKRWIEGVTAAVTDALSTGDQVRVMGFGTFSVVARKARPNPVPRVGERTIVIPLGSRPKFKPGKHLKDAVNGRG